MAPILKTTDPGGRAYETFHFRSEMAQNGNILDHTPDFLC